MFTTVVQQPTDAEQRAAAAELKACAAITTPTEAPAGTQLCAMADAANAASAERDDLAQRAASLRERLDAVRRRERAAVSLDDYASAAVARAEVIVLPKRLAEVEAAYSRTLKSATAKALIDARVRDIQKREPQRSYADALSDVYGAHPEAYELVRCGSYAGASRVRG